MAGHRIPIRRLALAAGLLTCIALAGARPRAQANYTFTRIADTVTDNRLGVTLLRRVEQPRHRDREFRRRALARRRPDVHADCDTSRRDLFLYQRLRRGGLHHQHADGSRNGCAQYGRCRDGGRRLWAEPTVLRARPYISAVAEQRRQRHVSGRRRLRFGERREEHLRRSRRHRDCRGLLPGRTVRGDDEQQSRCRVYRSTRRSDRGVGREIRRVSRLDAAAHRERRQSSDFRN